MKHARALLVAVCAAEFLTAAFFALARDWWSAMSFAMIGAVVLVALRHSEVSYGAGYFHGRAAMIRSLGEATRRGWTLDEWLVAESERDAVIAAEYLRRRPGLRRRQSKRHSQG